VKKLANRLVQVTPDKHAAERLADFKLAKELKLVITEMDAEIQTLKAKLEAEALEQKIAIT
jgi:hypothetical protein